MKTAPSALSGTSPKYDIETFYVNQNFGSRIWGRPGGGVVSLRETIRLMGEVDAVIEIHGGWSKSKPKHIQS
jgi:hypothetical protein